MEQQFIEAAGSPPAWILDPRIQESQDTSSAVVTARFYMGPDPRPDAVGNTIINEDGSVPVIELVEIINRNDPKNSPMVVVATDHHRYKARREGGFPEEYKAFLQGRELTASGIPLTDWIGDNARTKNLQAFNIYTVEQLALVSDSLCQTLGPGTLDLRKKAKAYLSFKKDSAVAEKAMAENDAMKRQMAEMQEQMARLMASVQQASVQAPEQELEDHPAELLPETPIKRGPGRPRVNHGE